MTERSKKVFERNCIGIAGMDAFPVHIVIALLEANERLAEALEQHWQTTRETFHIDGCDLSRNCHCCLFVPRCEALTDNDELMAKLAGDE